MFDEKWECVDPVLTTFYFVQIPKDTERLEGVIAMIDTWSMAYSLLVCVVRFKFHSVHFALFLQVIIIFKVGAVQVMVLKRFFVTVPTSSRLKMST